MPEELEISEVIKSLDALLYEDVTLHILNDQLEDILPRIGRLGLSIVAVRATKLFASFEFDNGIITAHLYKRDKHLLIKNLIEKHNLRRNFRFKDEYPQD